MVSSLRYKTRICLRVFCSYLLDDGLIVLESIYFIFAEVDSELLKSLPANKVCTLYIVFMVTFLEN